MNIIFFEKNNIKLFQILKIKLIIDYSNNIFEN